MSRNRKDYHLSRRAALTGTLALGSGVAACVTGSANHIATALAQPTPDSGGEPQVRGGVPNVVLIVLDDVGFADLGCYGSEIATPAMDALATGGLRYTNFRTTGVCSSTRASLLTGLNPHSAGMGWLTFDDLGFPGYRGDLAADAITLSEILSAHGYLSYHVGKWHVNADASATAVGPFENWPLQRGYSRAHWFQGHSADYFRPSNVFEGNQRVEIDDDYLASDAFTDSSIRFVREHAALAEQRPFLLSLAFNAAHSPLQAPAADILAQRGRYDAGWDEIRASRLERQIDLGVVPRGTRLPPRNRGVQAWDDLTQDQQRLYSRYMEIYAAVIERLDANVGRLVSALTDIGAIENTLIVLMSDNGGSPDGGPTGTPNLFASGVGGVTLEQVLPILDGLGGPDTYSMYPMGWAMASNTPFRLYKHDTHLGGVADPLILHWPRGISARGEVRTQYVHVSDILPTLLSRAGVSAPRQRAGRPVKPHSGVDFSSTFSDAAAPETRTEQHFELNGTRAYYADGWRLVSKGRFQQPDDGWELFDLSQECNEIDDIAGAHPHKVIELERRWIEAAHRYDVFPIDTRSLKEKSWAPFFRGGGRSRWELTLPMDLISEEAAPTLIGRSHTVEILLSSPLDRRVEGVLYAHGNMFLGCALFLQGGRLVHEFAAMPHVVRTTCALPVGASRLTVRHELTSRPWQGTLEVLADGRRAAFSHHEPLIFGRPMQGLQIGRNGSVPVSRAYQRPFAFTGQIRNVVIDLDVSPYTAEEIAAAMRPPPRI